MSTGRAETEKVERLLDEALVLFPEGTPDSWEKIVVYVSEIPELRKNDQSRMANPSARVHGDHKSPDYWLWVRREPIIKADNSRPQRRRFRSNPIGSARLPNRGVIYLIKVERKEGKICVVEKDEYGATRGRVQVRSYFYENDDFLNRGKRLVRLVEVNGREAKPFDVQEDKNKDEKKGDDGQINISSPT